MAAQRILTRTNDRKDSLFPKTSASLDIHTNRAFPAESSDFKVGPVSPQQLNDIHLAPKGGSVERRPTVYILDIDLAGLREDVESYFDVAVSCRHVKLQKLYMIIEPSSNPALR